MAYIADGFHHDSKNLLDEFALEKSSDFTVFTSIWIKKNFSFVYMGRQSAKELSEFTSEIFNVSSNYLTNESFHYQVCGVFLLYALYQNQILTPKIRIRVVICNFEILKILLDKAVAGKLYFLHYVLEYLFKNAFSLVANATLLGPEVRLVDKIHDANNSLSKPTFKSNVVEFKENKVLESLRDKLSKYEELKPPSQRCFSSDNFKKLINSLDMLVAELPTDDRFDVNKMFQRVSTADSDYNPTTDADEPPTRTASTKKMVINRTKCQKDNVQDEPCTSNAVVELPRPREIKQRKRRNTKTRRIRQYYDNEPSNKQEMPLPSSPMVKMMDIPESDESDSSDSDYTLSF